VNVLNRSELLLLVLSFVLVALQIWKGRKLCPKHKGMNWTSLRRGLSEPEFEGLCENWLRNFVIYEGVSKSLRTGRLERELQVVHLFTTRCSCITILCISLVSFATITLCVACCCYFVIDSVRKLFDTPYYIKS
jgi:hypothetical protein